jgi:hypothetical protein
MRDFRREVELLEEFRRHRDVGAGLMKIREGRFDVV